MFFLLNLLELDHQLFHFINSDIANPLFDFFLPPLREKLIWIPLYTYLLFFLIFNLRWTTARTYIILLILTVAVSDVCSSRIIKPAVQRHRPCNTELQQEVRMLANCTRSFSFTSSHAANHFALACFLIMTLGYHYRYSKLILLGWASSISIAQVYVGVHFPSDILFGALIGTIIGCISAEACNRYGPSLDLSVTT